MFVRIMQNPIIRLVFGWDVLVVFFVLPFLLGKQVEGSLIEVWKDGVCEIESFFAVSNALSLEVVQDSFTVKTLVFYLFIYIVGVGLSFGGIKVLYLLIGHLFERKQNEYSISRHFRYIAFLILLISTLLMFRENMLLHIGCDDMLVELIKYFVMSVLFIVLVILTVEAISFLLNMKRNPIRQGGQILLLYLIGGIIDLLLEIMIFVFNAIDDAIGGTITFQMSELQIKLRRKLTNVLETKLDIENELQVEQTKNIRNKHQMTFSAFDEKITKK